VLGVAAPGMGFRVWGSSWVDEISYAANWLPSRPELEALSPKPQTPNPKP